VLSGRGSVPVGSLHSGKAAADGTPAYQPEAAQMLADAGVPPRLRPGDLLSRRQFVLPGGGAAARRAAGRRLSARDRAFFADRGGRIGCGPSPRRAPGSTTSEAAPWVRNGVGRSSESLELAKGRGRGAPASRGRPADPSFSGRNREPRRRREAASAASPCPRRDRVHGLPARGPLDGPGCARTRVLRPRAARRQAHLRRWSRSGGWKRSRNRRARAARGGSARARPLDSWSQRP
jgi:hypothetical protein